ncbi:MAG: hypothetical protein K9H26_01730 [Prolixibacteraceae bacterium]|nr:hypothetical protein [Prolixibacteraceae bacterium]
MKKILLQTISVMLALVFTSVQALAYTTAPAMAVSEEEAEMVAGFSEAEIYAAFDEVSELETMIRGNDGITYSGLEANNSELVANLSATSAFSNATMTDTPPIFSAFMWGCLLNWVGMLIVGLTTGFDSSQIVKSGWGCLINGLLLGGGWIWSYSYY